MSIDNKKLNNNFTNEGNSSFHYRVCYFGIYDPQYPRNSILMKGLRDNGVEIIECNSRLKGFGKYWDLYRKHHKIKNQYDVMFVGFLGQGIMPLAKFLTRKKIIFDAFLSLYNTNVFDRKLYSSNGWRGRIDFFLDKFSCRIADLVILDTKAHIDYFVQTFGLKKDKFINIYPGTDDGIFYPIKNSSDKNNFTIHFHGYLVPFHGIEYIIEAAGILKDKNINWQIVTRFDGRYEAIKKQVEDYGLNNVTFKNVAPSEELNELINNADLCLGVFGDSPKTNLVIPNKIFESLACRKPIVTANSAACREILQDGVHCLYCNPADPRDLADKINKLINDNGLAENIADNGYRLYKYKLTPKIIGNYLKEIINKI